MENVFNTSSFCWLIMYIDAVVVGFDDYYHRHPVRDCVKRFQLTDMKAQSDTKEIF